ncbi:hypothetical protein GNP88_19165 [Aliivibrio fischeri]|uniref:Uncharacterized protein n=1 Tax=Aliivibrio fischeri TaxID=668 RepID=A0A844P7M5_ALIFS|nr:hypothetical protein [Aliivibrio fischeri]
MELEISNQCGLLLSIIIIYYNSALLSRLLQKYEEAGTPEELLFSDECLPLLGNIFSLTAIIPLSVKGKNSIWTL